MIGATAAWAPPGAGSMGSGMFSGLITSWDRPGLDPDRDKLTATLWGKSSEFAEVIREVDMEVPTLALAAHAVLPGLELLMGAAEIGWKAAFLRFWASCSLSSSGRVHKAKLNGNCWPRDTDEPSSVLEMTVGLAMPK